MLLWVQALKQSLRTGEAKLAKVRVTEVNARYTEIVEKTRNGVEVVLASASPRAPESDPLAASPNQIWERASRETIGLLRAAMAGEAVDVSSITFTGGTGSRKKTKVGDVAKIYLRKRASELRVGGYKSVRYSVGLFASKFDDRAVGSLGRGDGQHFLTLIAGLSRVIGKSEHTRGLGLDQLLAFSETRGELITARTQKRIWSQVNHFLDWLVYQAYLDQNPFRTVAFDRKVTKSPYAVLTDAEVTTLLNHQDHHIHAILLFCLLTGMRSGEAAGLQRGDLVIKGNLGTFAHIRANAVRDLKTDASERLVPLHSVLEGLLVGLPSEGCLFPELTVNTITKRFATLRKDLNLERPGLVFHSTRKWFITQCERTGVPEHFTASLGGPSGRRGILLFFFNA